MSSEIRDKVVSDAKDLVQEHIDEIVDQLIDRGEAKDSLDYYDEDYDPNEYFGLVEAAQVLEDLSNYEETDDHLWYDERDPKEALKTMAAYTYRNAVFRFFIDEISNVNEYAQDILDEFTNEEASIRETIEAIEGREARGEELGPGEEERLDAERVRLEALDGRRKKRLRQAVLEAIDRVPEPPKPLDPKDWRPRRS